MIQNETEEYCYILKTEKFPQQNISPEQLEIVRSVIISATISGKWAYGNKEHASLMIEEAAKEVLFAKSLSVVNSTGECYHDE